MAFFNIENTPLKNFESGANHLIERYYLCDYPHVAVTHYNQPGRPKANPRDGAIARAQHGAMHVSRVAAYIDNFHFHHLKFDPNLETNLEELARSLQTTPESLLLLTKYTGIMHDSARQAEGRDYWDEYSAQNLKDFLVRHQVPEYLASIYAACIEYKDNPDGYNQQILNINQRFNLNIEPYKASYLRELVQDGDCLDVMRVRQSFRMDYLNFYRKHASNPIAYGDLIQICKMAGAVIHVQGDASYPCAVYDHNQFVCNAIPSASFNIPLKLRYEQAQNPYLATRQLLVSNGFHVNGGSANQPHQVLSIHSNYKSRIITSALFGLAFSLLAPYMTLSLLGGFVLGCTLGGCLSTIRDYFSIKFAQKYNPPNPNNLVAPEAKAAYLDGLTAGKSYTQYFNSFFRPNDYLQYPEFLAGMKHAENNPNYRPNFR